MRSMLNESTKPLLGRCKEKGCDYALFVADTNQIVQGESLRDVQGDGRAYRVNNNFFARCPNRHKAFVLKRIKGTYSEDHKCDARCLNAKGHDCTCSCGGLNHGRGHVATIVQVEAPVSEPVSVAPYRINTAPEPVREAGHIGEIGKTIRGEVRVQRASKLDNGSTLYRFISEHGDILVWFAPEHADPQWEIDSVHTIRAKVKRHEDHERFGKSTIVTYVEEV